MTDVVVLLLLLFSCFFFTVVVVAVVVGIGGNLRCFTLDEIVDAVVTDDIADPGLDDNNF